MKLVDKENDLPLGFSDFFEKCLEALFKFSAVLGTGEHTAQIHGDDALILHRFRHIARDDTTSETFHDRSLPHPRLTNEDRVVLGATGKHL